MTRLQKKCLAAVISAHLLLVIAILCSGFIRPSPRPDNTKPLELISLKTTDLPANFGAPDATPPPPTPPVPTPPQPEQQVEPPKPVQPVEPPKPVEPVKTPEPIEPVVTKPEIPIETKPKPPRKIEVSLTPVVRKTPTQQDTDAQAKAAAEKAAKERAKAIARVENAIKSHASKSTKITQPSDNESDVANYADVVRSVYMQAWMPPNDAANDKSIVTATVTIARDGHIISAHINDKSGDAGVDNSVQKTLDHVQQIEPFPEGSTDTERTYPIQFDLSAKRNL